MTVDGGWAAQLTSRLTGVEHLERRIRANCPVCGDQGGYLSIAKARGGRQIAFRCFAQNCSVPAVLEALGLTADDLKIPDEQPRPQVNGNGGPEVHTHGPNGADNGHYESESEPGADEGEDEFQANLLRWKAQIFQVAETLVTRDLELRKLQGEELFKALVDSLLILTKEVRGYAPPEGMDEELARKELEEVARLVVPQKKSQQQQQAAPPPVETLELNQLYNLIDEWDRQPWVWQGILPHRSLSLIVGKSETGKSTLIYSLIYSVVKGVDFFGRQCEQGRVVYLAGDPVSEIVAGKTFREMGLESGVTTLAGALVAHPAGMKLLRDTVARVKPVLVVADTLAATVAIDTDKYGQSYQTQQPLSILARMYGPNFLMSHHSQKSAVESYGVIDAALGSVGVAAVASSRMGTKLYRRGGKKFFTFEMSNLRMGSPLEGEWIVHKQDSGMVVLGGLWKSRNIEMDKELILTALNKRGEMSKRTLWGELRPKPKWDPFNDALEDLINAGLVESLPKPGKGGGFIFRLKV